MKQRTREQQEELTDIDLVERYYAGQEDAFELLMRRYQESLYHFIFSVLKSEEACDVLQHVWIQTFSCLQARKAKAQKMYGDSLKSWLFQIAKNRCIDLLRKHRPLLFSEVGQNEEEDPIVSLIPDPSQGPEELLLEQELLQQWTSAAKALPLLQREVVRLRIQDVKFEEIGKTLLIPEATARTYCRRARLRVRKSLLEKGVLHE